MTSYLGLDISEVVDQTRLDKVVLAKKVGQGLCRKLDRDDRKAIEDVARSLASDISDEVRSVLAFELRICPSLSADIAENIAQDIDEIAIPFLETSCIFSDLELAELVPTLSEIKREAISKRPDIGGRTVDAILQVGGTSSVEYIVRNDNLSIGPKGAKAAMDRFGSNMNMMDHLSGRTDLPLSIMDDLIVRISDKCRAVLMRNYNIESTLATELADKSRAGGLWGRIKDATPAQIHGYVIDLKQSGSLSHKIILDIAARGSMAFLESAIASMAGVPRSEVKVAFTLTDPNTFVRILKASKVSKKEFEAYLSIARLHSGIK